MALVVKNSSANAGDAGSIPGSGRFPGGGHGNPLQYSCLENPKERGTWWPTVHSIAKSWIPLQQLSTTEIHHVYKMHFLTFKPFSECLFVCFSQLLFICLWPESLCNLSKHTKGRNVVERTPFYSQWKCVLMLSFNLKGEIRCHFSVWSFLVSFAAGFSNVNLKVTSAW